MSSRASGRGGGRAIWIAGAVALALAIASRLYNAVHYTVLWGFDAKYNWRYIERLKTSWALPPPDADWSTAHPPLFYYASAAVCRALSSWDPFHQIVLLRVLVAAAGLAIAGLAASLVRRTAPDGERRALLALGLVLFLPVHVYMSAMVTEEVVVAWLISWALVLAGTRLAAADAPSLGQAAALGSLAGAALLTKLTGALVLVALAGALLLDGWRRGALRSRLGPVAVLVLLTAVVGGWFYAHNLIRYGYVYPHGLATHAIMFTMPPGERHVLDYLRFPLATFRDPQVLNPDLLRSIWGSTYLTLWFDGHRVFLPTDTPLVSRVGSVILTLALLPSAACLIGLARGGRRVLRAASGVDTLLLLMTAVTLAGYVLFTWQNPWFVTSKGSFLLGLAVPYAYYTSEVLDDWLSRGGWIAVAVWAVLIALAVLVLGTFTFTEIFWDTSHMKKPGVVW